MTDIHSDELVTDFLTRHDRIARHPGLQEAFSVSQEETRGHLALQMALQTRRVIEKVFPRGEAISLSKSALRRRIHRLHTLLQPGGADLASQVAGAVADALGCSVIAERFGFQPEASEY